MSVRLGRDFSLLWLGQTVSMVGDQLSAFALPTLAVLLLDAPAGEVGLLTAVNTLSYPLFGLWAGVVLARTRARSVMIVTDLVRLAVFLVVPAAVLLGALGFGCLLAVVAIAGIATVFSDIAGQAYLPDLVPAGAVVPGNVRLQTSDTLSRLVAPSFAGILVQTLGYGAVFSLNAASFLASALTLWRIRGRDEPADRNALSSCDGTVRTPARMREAVRFVSEDRLLRTLTISATVRNLGATASKTALLPLAYQGLGLSVPAVGGILTMGAVGALVGSLSSGAVVNRLGVRRALAITGLEGLAWCVVPLSVVAAPAVVVGLATFTASIWLPIWNVVATTARQSRTPPRLQAGVHALARTINLSAIPIGAVVAGAAAAVLTAHVGVRNGLIAVLVMGNAVVMLSVVPLFGRAVRATTLAVRVPARAGGGPGSAEPADSGRLVSTSGGNG